MTVGLCDVVFIESFISVESVPLCGDVETGLLAIVVGAGLGSSPISVSVVYKQIEDRHGKDKSGVSIGHEVNIS